MFKLGKPYTWDEETGKASGECCFCGKEIEHFNDGGCGWILEAVDQEGKLGEYLYCCHPMCERVQANDAHEIHRCYNPTPGKPWKLDTTVPHDCLEEFGHYTEFVGACCPDCGGLPEEVDARLYDPKWKEFFSRAR